MLSKAASDRPWAVGDECTADTGRYWIVGKIRRIDVLAAKVESANRVFWVSLDKLYPVGYRHPEQVAAEQSAAHKARCDAVSVEAVALLKMIVDIDSSGVDYTEEQVEQAKRKAREIVAKVEEAK